MTKKDREYADFLEKMMNHKSVRQADFEYFLKIDMLRA